MKKIIFLIVTVLSFCKPSINYKIEKILTNPKIDDEAALSLIAKEIWEGEFKSAETEKLGNSKISLKVAFGSKLALTFYNQDEYAKVIAKNISIKIFQILQVGEKRNLETITVIFSKPFYIKGTNEMQDDFEIFRVKVNLRDIAAIDGFQSINAFETSGKEKPTEKVVSFAEKIRKLWKEELNDFGRIEIK